MIETVSDGLSERPGALVEGLSYPVADLLLLSFLAAILVLCGQRPGLGLACSPPALATTAVADAAYSARAQHRHLHGDGLDQPALAALRLLIVAAACVAPVARAGRGPAEAGWRSLFVSGTVGLAACAGYAYERHRRRRPR